MDKDFTSVNPPSNTDQPKTKVDRIFRWLENQGVSTVLLIAILGGVYVGLPGALNQIEGGYERNAAELQKAFDTQGKTIDRLMKYVERREGLASNDE